MNVLLLKRWLKEEGEGLIGRRLAGTVQLGAKSIALELVGLQGHVFMLISVEQTAPAMCLLGKDELEGREKPPGNFAKAVKFNLAGYDLASISQEGFDRSVVFTFRHQDAYGKVTEKALRVELAGRASNAFIISDRGMVVSIFKPYKKGVSTVRHIMTGKPLPEPPPLGKFVAQGSILQGLEDELVQLAREEGAEGEGALEVLMTRRVAGGEPRLWPALEQLMPVEHSLSSLFDFISKFQHGEFTGAVYGLGEGYSANDAAKEAWLSDIARGGGRKGADQGRVAQLQSRLNQLLEQRDVVGRADEIEALALRILGNAERVDEAGEAREYIAKVAEENPDWAGQLDVAKSALENGRELANYCERLRRAASKLDSLVAKAKEDLQQARIGGGDADRKPGKKRPADPMAGAEGKLSKYGIKYMKFVSSDGIPILCGTNDKSNDGLIKVFGSGRHLWFHVRDYAGSHVILLTGGQEPPVQSIMDAALVAGYYSQGRNESELEVSYLPMKHLRRPRNAKPGQVLKMQETVVRVRPGQFEDRRGRLTFKSG